MNKKCNKCGETYVLSEENFHRNKFSKDGFSQDCKFCKNKNKREYRKIHKRTWKEFLLNSMKSRENGRGEEKRKGRKPKFISSDINSNFLEELKESQNGLCYWLNIPIDFSHNDKLRSPSLDRLDNSKGYTTDNVVLCTQYANLGRQSENIDNYKRFLKTYIN